jgi:hypothetical protein
MSMACSGTALLFILKVGHDYYHMPFNESFIIFPPYIIWDYGSMIHVPAS